MKKLLTLTLLTVISQRIFSQQDRYVIYFTDKNNSPYSISSPLDFVSQRSIDRRNKQGIPFTTNDLPVNPSYVQGVISAGATLLNVSRWLNTATIQTTDTNVLNAIYALPYVKSGINVGRIVHKLNDTDESFSKFKSEELKPYATSYEPSQLKVSSLSYGASFNQIKMMNGDYLHDNGFTGDGMMIAIIDAGFTNVDIMTAFDSLRSNNKIIARWNFVSHDTIVDVFTHGSMCFSIMGSNEPGVMVGSAPHASYVLLVSEDAATEYLIEEYNWASAAEYADSIGADVLSTSLGYTEFLDPNQNHTYADMNGNTTPITIAADLAAAKGMVICNAAGNEGGSSWNYISAPADADSILAVGAVDSMGYYAGFSGNGPSSDGRVKPDVSCQGQDTYVVSPWDGTVHPGSGTSFACPLLAGLATCFWQEHPNLTNMQIMQAIRESASIFSNPDTQLGYGIPDFMKADLMLGIATNTSSTHELITYPNPVSDFIYFNCGNPKTENAVCRIVNIEGRIVDEKNLMLKENTFSSLNLNKNIAKGFYFLQVITNDKSFVQKFLKD